MRRHAGPLQITGTPDVPALGTDIILVYGFDSHDSYGYPEGMAFMRVNPLGDRFTPAITQISVDLTQLRLRATDSEDRDADGELYSGGGEDSDGDGVIGPRNEDKSGWNPVEAVLASR